MFYLSYYILCIKCISILSTFSFNDNILPNHQPPSQYKELRAALQTFVNLDVEEASSIQSISLENRKEFREGVMANIEMLFKELHECKESLEKCQSDLSRLKLFSPKNTE